MHFLSTISCLCMLMFVEFSQCKKQIPEDGVHDVFLSENESEDENANTMFNHRRMIKFKSFAEDVETYLNPDNAILFGEDTPVWRINGTGHWKKFNNGMLKRALAAYENDPARAAMVVRSRQHTDYNLYETSGNVLYPSLDTILETKRLKRGITRLHIVNKDTIYPTIFVTTDFNSSIHSNDESAYYDEIIYQMAYWNAVDLRYRRLRNPKVRLRIAGILIGTDREATPYVSNHTTDGKVELSEALDHMAWQWALSGWEPVFRRESYHVVVTATDLPLGSKLDSTIEWAGMSFPSTLCTANSDAFKAITIFQDDRSFGTVNTVVHELAHVFGIYHDNGTDGKCDEVDGYIMSPVISDTDNNMRFSNCSLNRLSAVLRLKDCADQPREYWPAGRPLGKILPGTIKSVEEQCKGRNLGRGCEFGPQICKNLHCWSAKSCVKSWSAADGTVCGDNRICLDGECKSLYPAKVSRTY